MIVLTLIFASFATVKMGNIFLSLMVALFSFQTFTLTYQVSTFKKSVVNIPISLFESCISFYELAGNLNKKPFYKKEKLEMMLSDYFKKALTPCTNKYSYDLYYFDSNDHKLCKGDYCDGIKISCRGTILFAYEISETMSYEIKDNRNG